MFEKLWLLPLGVAAGFALRKYRLFTQASAATLNVFIIWISYPAMVAVQAPKLLSSIQLTPALFWPVAAAWLAFVAAAAVIWWSSRRLGLSRGSAGALTLTAGLGNTSFVGFALIDGLYGSEGLKTALIVDQLGSFPVLSTLGLLCASAYAGRKFEMRQMLLRMARFPPFIALAMTVAAHFLPPSSAIAADGGLISALERLAATLVPLALVSVGCQLNFSAFELRRNGKALAFGLALRLALLPAALTGLIWLFHKPNQMSLVVTILETAMGPMITGAIVAGEFGLAPELANLMVAVGTPLSLLTVVGWNTLLTRF